jgi:peptidoglycan/LPS O-acetylase OafA/YrhL
MNLMEAVLPSKGTAAPALSRLQPARATAQVRPRDQALDFTKGALVLIMVLYHWMNYFVDLQWDAYRYLRFLTPSFIFIAAFIVSNAAIGRPRDRDRAAFVRLLQRGFKLLLVFSTLNVLIGVAVRHQGGSGVDRVLGGTFTEVYVRGSSGASFDVLVPIAYFLLIAPAVLWLSRRLDAGTMLVAALSIAAAIIGGITGIHSPNLELLAIAMLGLFVGTTPISTIQRKARLLWVVPAYAAYVAAIAAWNVLFPLQIVGVCLSLLVLYMAGSWGGSDGVVQRHVILLGKYSLLGYIVQVLVLQVLRRGMSEYDLVAMSLIPFLVTLVATVGVVQFVDAARTRSRVIDRCYRAVFA